MSGYVMSAGFSEPAPAVEVALTKLHSHQGGEGERGISEAEGRIHASACVQAQALAGGQFWRFEAWRACAACACGFAMGHAVCVCAVVVSPRCCCVHVHLHRSALRR